MKNPKVAIVIATYNQEKLLVECLKSLEKTNYKNYRIFFVDDTGRGIGKDIAKRFNVELITTKGRSGQTGVWNAGIKKALEWGFDYVLLLDDDMEFPDKDWLIKVVGLAESDNEIGMVGCNLIYPDGRPQNSRGYIKGWKITNERGHEKDPIEVDHIVGCFMLIKRSVIDKVGLVDEIYNPYLLEETDYCLRVKKSGFKIFSAPYVDVKHKKHGTISTIPNPEKRFVRFKNDIIFSRRHFNFTERLFRFGIYLPMVAIFRKQRDEDDLELKNFSLRKEFIINLWMLVKAFRYVKENRLK